MINRFLCLSVFSFLLTYQAIHAQKNTVYVELLGTGGLYTANYERSFPLGEKARLNGRIAAAVRGGFVMPIGLSLDLGKQKNYLQFSANRDFFGINFGGSGKSSSIGIGYVRRPVKGFYFHTSLMYLMADEGIAIFDFVGRGIPWLGIGLGYSFL